MLSAKIDNPSLSISSAVFNVFHVVRKSVRSLVRAPINTLNFTFVFNSKHSIESDVFRFDCIFNWEKCKLDLIKTGPFLTICGVNVKNALFDVHLRVNVNMYA